jgi:hypothetical protein
VRNKITWLRTKSGDVKLTAYSADRIHFDGQSCVLAVSADLPEYNQHKVESSVAVLRFFVEIRPG